jgi:polar amino acid transport system permease protein
VNVASLRYLAIGAGMTISLAAAVIVLSAAIGMLLAVARLYAWPPIVRLAEGYALVIRGVPLLILLIGAYFSLPYLGMDMPLYAVVVLVMGLYFGAYMGEVFRGAIASVPRTQWDAGRSVGFRWPQIFGIVVLPQARRLSVAPFLNVALTVVKNTSLVSAIGGWELVAAGREIGERTGDLLTVYLAIASVYFAICFPLARLASFIERRSHA